MILIKETFKNNDTVNLHIEGRLDRESLPTLRQVCDRYLKEGLKIELNLSSLNHIGQDGLRYLQVIRHRVQLIEMNEYFRMAILDEDPEDQISS